MKLALKITGAVLAVLIVAALALVYVFGPSVGAAYLGKPVFLFGASESRINKAMLDTAAMQGLYADSPEFKQAYDAAKEDSSRIEDAITAAGGKHSTIFTRGEEESVPHTDPKVELRNNVVWATVPGIGRFDDGQAYADTLAHGLSDAPACAAVVDLRGNGGGDMGPMLAGLGPLLPDGPALYFQSRARKTPVMIDGNHVAGGGTPTTTSGGKLDLPVAVLTDGETASSGEATLLAFRGLDNVRTFGEPTAGYASANVVIDYPDGRSLMLTVAKDVARTGEEFAEDPVAPDAPLSELDGWLHDVCR